MKYRFNYPPEFTSLPAYTKHAGALVTITRQLTSEETEFEMVEIKAEDGWIGHAFIDELEEIRGS